MKGCQDKPEATRVEKPSSSKATRVEKPSSPASSDSDYGDIPVGLPDEFKGSGSCIIKGANGITCFAQWDVPSSHGCSYPAGVVPPSEGCSYPAGSFPKRRDPDYWHKPLSQLCPGLSEAIANNPDAIYLDPALFKKHGFSLPSKNQV